MRNTTLIPIAIAIIAAIAFVGARDALPNDHILIGSSNNLALPVELDDCQDTGGNHLNYTQSTNEISCGTSGGGGSAVTLDLADDASNESTDIGEIATVNDTGNCFTEPSADKLLIDVQCIDSGSVNSFETINAPTGTDPVADSSTDTLALTSTDGTVSISGNSTTDTVDFSAQDLSCTDCIGTTEIDDSYVLNAGDSMTGALNMDNNTAVQFSELDANGANFVSLQGAASIGSNLALILAMTGDCTGNANGGVLTINASNEITCDDDDSGAGGSSEWTDTGTILHPNEDTLDEIAIGGTTEAGADIFLGVDGTAVFNEQGNAVNFRVEGDTDPDLIFGSGTNDTVTIGSQTSLGKLGIDGDADEIQLLVQGNGTQTSNVVVVETSAGADLLTVDNSGNVAATGNVSGGNVTSGADPGHTHTGASISGVDISDDTNLTGGTGLTLTDDDLSFTSTELGALTWGSGSGFAWTYDVGATDPVLTWASGLLTLAASHFEIDDEGELRWHEEDANGSNYIAVKAPAAVTSNITCTLEDDSTPFDSCTSASTPGFDAITTGTNTTATMTVGTGASIVASGTGAITATAGDSATSFFSTGTLEDARLPTSMADKVFTGSVQVPNGTAPTVNADGEIAHDTTADQLVFGADADVISSVYQGSITIESPSDSDNILMGKWAAYGITVTDIFCIVDPADTGESVVITLQERDATADNPAGLDGATTITCDNDGAEDDGALSNGTIDKNDWISIDIGTVTGTVSQLSVSWVYTITRE